MRTSRLRTLDLTVTAMFVALMAVGANITSWAPFLQVAGIPLSMQPFFSILAGLLLGSRLGSLSMFVYVLAGLVGLPVFAQFKSGIGVIMGPTGGFLLSFIAVAFIVGKVVEQKKQPTFGTFLLASLIGITLNYVIGTNYMYFAVNTWIGSNMSYSAAWKIMMWFIVKDLAFTVFGAVLAPRLYRAITRSSLHQSRNIA
ncbi:biotin transporter BioY [Bacillus sp. 165]|uniref:biotin transporter BioY n=1 Tax=Bacillus sp. 165 TaxID=1529117 RepID=UPI001ADB7F6D|nr:biotin transporter BioY [Bacillus sp. 165]MBO9130671.1 biotin transporter BioY [Bacillus sp. 165]